jgi:hypothetical protein
MPTTPPASPATDESIWQDRTETAPPPEAGGAAHVRWGELPIPGPGESGDKEDKGAGGRGRPPGGLPRRRGPADPVKSVLHRHHDLIATAADPWEIAAGLEARGVTDGDARRLRHRDVFGLADELFARVPRVVRLSAPGPAARERTRLGPRDTVLQLLPGLVAICAAAVHLPGPAALGGVVLTGWPALRTGPLRTRRGAARSACVLLLLALARCGPHPVGNGTLAVLALTLLPAAYLAGWFADSARAQLAPSHGLADFADAVRPRLVAALAAYAAVLLVLLAVLGTFRGCALGLLLFTARLLAVHGGTRTAASGLAAACAAQALCLAVLPPGPAEAAACGGAAIALAAHALRLLPGASAHRI